MIANLIKGEINMEKLRGFEIAKGWEDKNINLPKRSTNMLQVMMLKQQKIQ